MEKFTYTEKVAIIKVLDEILNADNIVHEKEVQYMNEVFALFGFNEIEKVKIDALITLQALATIREMTIEKKALVAQMMGKMIVIDGDINYNEVKLYNAFCQSCDIDKDFNITDYPEYTLSGSFINPEDIMNSDTIV